MGTHNGSGSKEGMQRGNLKKLETTNRIGVVSVSFKGPPIPVFRVFRRVIVYGSDAHTEKLILNNPWPGSSKPCHEKSRNEPIVYLRLQVAVREVKGTGARCLQHAVNQTCDWLGALFRGWKTINLNRGGESSGGPDEDTR